ncbi:MAG: EI24 domain-containing protein [Flavobacteriales bacterium]|nr:EI24 domain-containing protein [Flavobacteriales bacterium]
MKNGLWTFFLYPLLFIILFAVLSAYGISYASETVSPWLYDLLGIEPMQGDGWWDKTVNVLEDLGKYFITFVVWITFAFMYYKISKYVVLICLSPVMAFVSEKTERVLTGNSTPFNWNQFFKDIMRGVLLALRNLAIELTILLILTVINVLIGVFVAPLAVITTPLVAVISFLIGAYFYGFSTMDYTSERRKLSIRESIKFIRRNKALATTNGSIFTLWLIIPIFGTYVGTIFAPITCTVAATLAIHEMDKSAEKVLPEGS